MNFHDQSLQGRVIVFETRLVHHRTQFPDRVDTAQGLVAAKQSLKEPVIEDIHGIHPGRDIRLGPPGAKDRLALCAPIVASKEAFPVHGGCLVAQELAAIACGPANGSRPLGYPPKWSEDLRT